jgi:hypothetical protein
MWPCLAKSIFKWGNLPFLFAYLLNEKGNYVVNMQLLPVCSRYQQRNFIRVWMMADGRQNNTKGKCKGGCKGTDYTFECDVEWNKGTGRQMCYL